MTSIYHFYFQQTQQQQTYTATAIHSSANPNRQIRFSLEHAALLAFFPLNIFTSKSIADLGVFAEPSGRT